MPHLSIVIPAFNEAERLPTTLDAIRSYLADVPYTAELIVVDDGSTDETVDCARRYDSAEVPLRVLESTHNQGKGAAVQRGMLAADGEYVLFMDADSSTRIEELDKLLPLAKEGYPIVIGSRYLERGSIKIKQPWYRIVISRFGNLLIRLVLLPGIKDTQCGFKLFHRHAARQIAPLITMRRFSFDMEILTVAKNMGERIKEVPVNWYDTPNSRLRPVKASLQTFSDLLIIRLNLFRGRYSLPLFSK